MTSPVVPLASNDLFGGAHLGQHAERIQPNNHSSVVGSRSIRNHVKPPSKKRGAIRPAQDDSPAGRRELNHATLVKRNCFPAQHSTCDFSDNQTFNIVE